MVTARIRITVDLDEAAWNWELHGPDKVGGESWDSKPEDIVHDCLDYASGWRLTSEEPDPLFGKVVYSASIEFVE